MGRWAALISQHPQKAVAVTITDRNVDGRISVSELRKGLRQTLGEDIFSAFYKSWTAAKNADKNHDGFISDAEMEGLKTYASSQWNIHLTVSVVDADGKHIKQGDLK